MRIATAQIVSERRPGANLDQVAEQTAQAAGEGADLVIFPEATMRRSAGLWRGGRAHRRPLGGAAGRDRRAARGGHRGRDVRPGRRGTGNQHLAGGGAGGGRPLRQDPPLRRLRVHRVRHGRPRHRAAGSPARRPGVGFATCYDLRFPGLFTTLAERGAELICVPASWGAGPGKIDQWQLLIRARALDCTSCLAAAGQADPATVGQPTGSAPTGVGYSAVVGPDGHCAGLPRARARAAAGRDRPRGGRRHSPDDSGAGQPPDLIRRTCASTLRVGFSPERLCALTRCAPGCAPCRPGGPRRRPSRGLRTRCRTGCDAGPRRGRSPYRTAGVGVGGPALGAAPAPATPVAALPRAERGDVPGRDRFLCRRSRR